jgi:hypothetical protein
VNSKFRKKNFLRIYPKNSKIHQSTEIRFGARKNAREWALASFANGCM